MLGRDLSKVMIIDNVAENFSLQDDNGIPIKNWYSDPQDQELYKMQPFLKSLASKKVADVRPHVIAYKT